MTIKTHYIKDLKIAELTSDHLIIKSAGDGVDLLGNIYYQGFDKMIVHADNITPDFFDLKTGMAGEILQKFSTYRMGLAIVVNFDAHNSKSLHDFILKLETKGLIPRINFLNLSFPIVNAEHKKFNRIFWVYI